MIKLRDAFGLIPRDVHDVDSRSLHPAGQNVLTVILVLVTFVHGCHQRLPHHSHVTIYHNSRSQADHCMHVPSHCYSATFQK